jgi:segregation and condensation protein B
MTEQQDEIFEEQQMNDEPMEAIEVDNTASDFSAETDDFEEPQRIEPETAEPADFEENMFAEAGEEDDDASIDSTLDEKVETTVESVIEAILFASDEPLTKARLVKIAELSSSAQVSEAIKSLNAKYRANNCAFRVERIAGGYQMMTLSIYNTWLIKMLKVKTDSKLTQAALETLAIIAYKQPIIRADVEGIRGVASGEMIRSLMYKGLVKIVGRAEVIGRPMLYGTTKKFLEVFGLNTLKDLPSVEELKKPS